MEPTIGRAATAAGAPIEGLPASARNVAWFLPGSLGPTKAYEFDATEAVFDAWVSALSDAGPTLQAVDVQTIHGLDAEGYPNREHAIEHGRVYRWSFEDESVTAAYDRALGRAFYRRNYR